MDLLSGLDLEILNEPRIYFKVASQILVIKEGEGKLDNTFMEAVLLGVLYNL